MVAILLLASAAVAADSSSASTRPEDVDARIAALQKRVATGAEPSSADDILTHYRDRLALAAAVGLEKAAPVAGRVQYLLASGADLAQLRTLTEQSEQLFEALYRQLSDQVEQARVNEDMVVLGLPVRLAGVLDEVVYKRAWVRYYLACSLGSAGGEPKIAARRRRLFADAAEDAAEYAAGDAASGIKYWAILLQGMATARAGDGATAERLLRRAAEPSAQAEVRKQAMFELARLAVDRWDYARALQQVRNYRDHASVLDGAAGKPRADLHAAILTYYLCRGQANATKTSDPAASSRFLAAGDMALAQLFDRYPNALAALSKLIAQPWEGVADLGQLPKPIVFARGMNAAAAGADSEAIRCFSFLMDRSDAASRLLTPHCLWRLAVAQYKQGRQQGAAGWPDRRAAAERFVQLAEQFPDSKGASGAAANAASIIGSRLAVLVEAGRPVPEPLRAEYIHALTVLVNGDTLHRRRDEFMCDLAGQYRLLGEDDEALKWYRKVSESSWANSVARVAEMMLHADRLGRVSPGARKKVAEGIVAQLVALSVEAGRDADAMDDPRRKAALYRAGAEADYRAGALMASDMGLGSKAALHTARVAKRWGGCDDIVQAATRLHLKLLIADGRLGETVEVLEPFRTTHPDAASQATLVAALEGRDRVDLFRLAGDGAQTHWPVAYLRLAELAQRAIAAGSPDQQYPYRQIRAEALAEAGRVAEGLELFARLSTSRPTDAKNIQGMARCDWLARRYGSAMKRYQQLLAKLDPAQHPDLWWRVQLSLARCALDNASGRRSECGRLRVRLKQLKGRSSTYGGYAEYFERLGERVAEAAAKE